VIGVPLEASSLRGLDALLATVQMPKGVPVATVRRRRRRRRKRRDSRGADLALSDAALAQKLSAFKKELETKAVAADESCKRSAEGSGVFARSADLKRSKWT